MKTLIYLCTTLLVISTAGWAQTPLIPSESTGDPKDPWHLTANVIAYDDETQRYSASGDVVIKKKGRRLTADHVFFDHKNMCATARGDIVMTAGKNYLRGQRAEIDLERETGTVWDGTLFMQANHFYIKGRKIEKTGPETYTVNKGGVTSCDGDKPAWRITGRKLKVTIEGYGTVQHATLWARKLPVVYMPFLVFPAKFKRQTGFLAPQFGMSERKGEYYIQPFFWAINDQSDATFYWQHMGQRGEKLGIEYRYALSEYTKGAVMFDFLNDRRIDDGQGQNTSDWGYEGDSVLRTNRDRYWFRMKHDQLLPLGFLGRLDLDIVSDQDYLHEFLDEHTGFDATNVYFSNTFGRSLDDFNDSVRVNSFSMSRSWSQYSLIAETRWYDNVIVRRSGASDTTIQKLPYVEFAGTKHRLLNTPFYFDLNSQYQYFYREQGARSHRVDLYPRFYLPLQARNYFTLEPSVGLRETIWQAENDPAVESKHPLTRHIYDLKVDLFTEVYKIYRLMGSSDNRLKHSLRPQIIYTYVPPLVQGQYPSFDAYDRIAETNTITYSLTNLFVSRTSVVNDTSGSKNTQKPTPLYKQIGRLWLEQSYDINKGNRSDPRPFSDISAQIELQASSYWSLQADTTWSPYTHRFPTRNIALQLKDKRGDALSLEYRYSQNTGESVRADMNIQITSRLSAFSDYEHNLMIDKMIDMNVGFEYTAQCWTFRVGYGEEGELRSRKFTFFLVLHGLGGIGRK
jgi:LPS-assembly protein